jgi:hypothetical protein
MVVVMRTGTWCCVLLLVGCGAKVDVIDHGGGGEDGGDGSGEGADAAIDDPALRGGNFPEPSVTVCGVLPAGVEPIDDLATAWVIEGNRPANSTELPVGPTVPRLRLGSVGIESDGIPNDGPLDPECGHLGWMFAFDLPDPLAPGILQLAELPATYAESYERFEDGCGYGAQWAAQQYFHQGELEIFAVTETCVMGELRGTGPEPTDVVPVRDGGFVAQRDNVACVPMSTLECD